VLRNTIELAVLTGEKGLRVQINAAWPDLQPQNLTGIELVAMFDAELVGGHLNSAEIDDGRVDGRQVH
jgi:hypothetical protein